MHLKVCNKCLSQAIKIRRDFLLRKKIYKAYTDWQFEESLEYACIYSKKLGTSDGLKKLADILLSKRETLYECLFKERYDWLVSSLSIRKCIDWIDKQINKLTSTIREIEKEKKTQKRTVYPFLYF
ncbi:MAG: hypothetical protein DRP00_00315 [Candidatus Aenigmatarchaeota archaeon]|nr:MAG: hypothetical protein DRP00_00315 [Candidatus Aenigmarchaeota archaeon]